MIKHILIFLFVLIFSLSALDYFHMVPSDEVLAFNNISYMQKRNIENFNDKPKTQKKSILDKFPFTGKYSK